MSTAKGTRFESSILPLLQESLDPTVHRLGKQGAKDCGDFWLPPRFPYVIEAKNEARYGGRLSGWLAEAETEAKNANRPFGVVVHKRHGVTAPERQYVTLELLPFLILTSS